MVDLNKLERLNKLRKSGALSAEEFDREKALLLEGQAAKPWPLIIIGLIALVIVVAAVVVITRQTGDAINNSVVASSGKPVESGSSASVRPTPTPLPRPPQVDRSVAATAAPDPTDADYYNEAKRDMMRQYRDQPPGIRAMLGDYAGAEVLCRGSSDEPTIKKWCPIRDALGVKLRGLGMCYGRSTDQSAADSDWHTCEARDEDQTPG